MDSCRDCWYQYVGIASDRHAGRCRQANATSTLPRCSARRGARSSAPGWSRRPCRTRRPQTRATPTNLGSTALFAACSTAAKARSLRGVKTLGSRAEHPRPSTQPHPVERDALLRPDGRQRSGEVRQGDVARSANLGTINECEKRIPTEQQDRAQDAASARESRRGRLPTGHRTGRRRDAVAERLLEQVSGVSILTNRAGEAGHSASLLRIS